MTSGSAATPSPGPRHSPAVRVVGGLVRARLRRRRSAAALIATAVGGCIVVLGSLLGVGVVTADLATRAALADLPASERLVGIVLASEDGSDADASDALAGAALAGLGSITEPLVRATVYRPTRVAARVVVMDGQTQSVVVSEGRLPVPCEPPDPCEAVRMSAFSMLNGTGAIGTTARIQDQDFVIVGNVQPGPDFPVDVAGTPGLVLLAEGIDALAHDPALADTPRSASWLAPLDPQTTHAWMLDELGQRVDSIRRDLSGSGRPFRIESPDRTIASVQARADVAVGRLIFISSFVIGVLLAFAVFASTVERPDVGREYRRLRVAGAGRGELSAFIGLEAFVPALVGAAAGALAATLIVAAIAASQGEPAADVVRLALLSPVGLTTMLGVSLIVAAAVAAGMHPASARLVQPRIIATATLPVLVVLIWDRATSGPIDAATLASQAIGPGTVLLPGVLGLAVILGSLVVLPPLLRRLARATARAPFALRLATMSIARDPLRPAATLTLLAFSLGLAVLGVAYAGTLERGAADQAAFATGLDVRLQSYSPSGRFTDEVLPRVLAGDLGSDVEVRPIVRLEGESATHRPFLLTGLDPSVLLEFRRWRDDFANTSQARIADLLAMPGPWVLPGHPLADGTRELAIEVDYAGDPIALTVIVGLPDGTYRYVDLGDLTGGQQVLRHPLVDEADPGAPRPGSRIVGLLVGNGGPTAASGPDPGGRQQGELRILGLPEIVDPGTAVHVDVSGLRTRQMIRAAVRTDGLVLSALVSPDLGADVDANGVLSVTLVSGLPLRLRPIATIDRLPTQLEQGTGIVVLDQGPLLLAMTAFDPGSGTPNQLLLRTPDDARTAEVVARLSTDPYPPLVIRSRPALEAARARDPFAIGVVWALAVGALAGLLLSLAGVLMGAASELRDERGELRDLEELGARPSALRRLVVIRAAVLAMIGIAAGAVVGLALGWLAAALIAVSADGRQPVPPLALVTPWLAMLVMGAALFGGVTVGVLVLARRQLRPDRVAGQRS